MVKAKFDCFFFAVFIFAFFIDGVLNQGIAVEVIPYAQATSCGGCVDDGTTSRKWCVGGGFQGCRLTGCTSPTIEKTCNAAASASPAEVSANCEGCIKASHIWCVEDKPDDSYIARRCIAKGSSTDLSKGHKDCLNGKIYDQCTKSPLDDTVPKANELTPEPAIQACRDCPAGHRWCKTSGSNEGETHFCRVTDCTGFSPVTCGASAADDYFKYNYPPRTCKACVLKDDYSWCSRSNIVGFAGCVKDSVDRGDKCPGGRVVKTCENGNDKPTPGYLLSMTCRFCKGIGNKWCTRKEDSDKDAVVTRKCFSGSCPSGSSETETCPDSLASFTYLPPVPQDLPATCGDCRNSQKANNIPLNSWCNQTQTSSNSDVGSCLPSWDFGFICTTAAATCPSNDKSRKLEDNPFYLPQTCDGCVTRGNEWCVTEVDNYKYQFCIPEDREDLCGGDAPNVVRNCRGLKSAEKKALIPTPVPKTCEICVNKGGWNWWVHSGSGNKIRMCLPKDVADKLRNNETSVAFHHCNIAPEDKKLELGLFKILFDGSSFVSLSVMTIAVVIGFSFL